MYMPHVQDEAPPVNTFLDPPMRTKLSARRRQRRGLSAFPVEAVLELEKVLFAQEGTSETFQNATATLAANCTLVEEPPQLVRCLHRAGRDVYSHDRAAVNCVKAVVNEMEMYGTSLFEYFAEPEAMEDVEEIYRENPDASLVFYKAVLQLTVRTHIHVSCPSTQNDSSLCTPQRAGVSAYAVHHHYHHLHTPRTYTRVKQ